MDTFILLACVHTGVTEELLEEENDRMMSDISSKTRTLKQVGLYLSLYAYVTGFDTIQLPCMQRQNILHYHMIIVHIS